MIKFRLKDAGFNRFVAATVRAPEAVLREVRVAMKDGFWKIAIYAGTHHRYRAQSGRLDEAYRVVVTKGGLVAELILVKDSSVPYSHRIHEGWGSWRPDRFLIKAVKAKQKEFKAGLRAAVERGILKAGL